MLWEEYNMDSIQLNKILIDNFPQLKAKYFEEVSWQDGDSTGSHVVFGDVFRPYLIDCITHNKKQEIENAFSFLEELLNLNDAYAEEVIAFSVFESIAYLFSDYSNLDSLLGAYSKKVLADVS